MKEGLPRYWRLHDQLYQLVGEECKRCGSKLFPPRDVFPGCCEKAAVARPKEGGEPFLLAGRDKEREG